MNPEEKARLVRIGKYECVFAAIVVAGMVCALYRHDGYEDEE